MVARTVLGVVGAGLVTAGLVGCGGPGMSIDSVDVAPIPRGGVASGPLFNGDVVRASKAYPINAGTLIVTRDGSTAVAADPDRAQVFLADLGTRAVRSVATLADDEVGRVIEGEAGRVYVVARRGGAVLRIDVATGTLLQRMAVCNAPRGVAFDEAKHVLHVACASGALVTLDPESGTVTRKLSLDADLRDVLVEGDGLLVTRFRSSEFILLDETGKEVTRTTPKLGFGIVGPATLAYRATQGPNNTVVIVHQQSSDWILGSGAGSYYGGNCGGLVTDTYVSTVQVPKVKAGVSTSPYLSVQSEPLGGAVGPLDVAVGTDGRKLGIVATGNSWKVDTRHPTLGVITGGLPGVPSGGCWDQSGATLRDGEPVAIAFDSQNRYVVQYREPAKLVLETTDLVSEIRLSTDSRADTGLAMFYMNTSGGVACASCHPEGGVDGHVWKFDFGERVTQPLEGQISKRAPFHWTGDLGNWTSLVNEVMMKRMSLPVVPSEAQNDALLGWLDTIANRLPPDGLDAAAVERGRAVFQDSAVGCAACHSGTMYTDNTVHQVGTSGAFVTPSLLGVGTRSPLMHSGCALNIRGRFSECGGGNLHGNTASLSTPQLDDLISFVRSL